jgi:hypothetical protein
MRGHLKGRGRLLPKKIRRCLGKRQTVEGTTNPAMRESEVVSSEGCVVTAGSQQIEGKPLVLLQVNCKSILNKVFEFWNLVGTYNPDVIGTE